MKSKISDSDSLKKVLVRNSYRDFFHTDFRLKEMDIFNGDRYDAIVQ